MTKVRHIDLRHDEFLAGIAGEMSPDELGVYWMICLLIYSKRRPIPDDVAALASKFSRRTNPRTVRAALDRLVAIGKVHRTDGELMVNRCRDELESASNRIRTASENGSNGGRPSKKNKDITKPAGFSDEKLTTNPPTHEHTNGEEGGGGNARAEAETLVARFKELRLELWPNESGFPAPHDTLIELARDWLGDDVPAAALIETLERGMRADAANGMSARVTLKAYRKSLADAATRFRNGKKEIDHGNPDRSAAPVGAGNGGGQWGHTRQHAAKSAALAGLDRAFGGRRD